MPGFPTNAGRIGASVFNSVRFLIEGEVISANLGAHTGCTRTAVGSNLRRVALSFAAGAKLLPLVRPIRTKGIADMIAASDCYSFLDAQSNELTRSPAGFTALITPSAAEYPEALHRSLVDRYRVIKEWQAITLTLIEQSLRGELDSAIAGLFLHELPEYLRNYHKDILAEVQINTPVFFRTDEPILGTIAEVQAP